MLQLKLAYSRPTIITGLTYSDRRTYAYTSETNVHYVYVPQSVRPFSKCRLRLHSVSTLVSTRSSATAENQRVSCIYARLSNLGTSMDRAIDWHCRCCTTIDSRPTKHTRKLSYRKDDRAMRPIWVPWKFSGVIDMPTATFPIILIGFCSDRSYECTYKIWSSYSFTRSWDNIGGTKNWAFPGYAHAPFSPKFLMAFLRMATMNVPAKFWSP